MGALSFGLTLLVTFLTERWLGLGQALLLALAGTYASLFVMGVLTLLTEHRRIRATWQQKIASAFCFPLFMITFIPIAATAVFRKFQWQPITHTVAISHNQLQGGSNSSS